MSKPIKFAVSSSNFKFIREKGFVYVDKTRYVHQMVEGDMYYFLSRPRRFGKSMFLDTDPRQKVWIGIGFSKQTGTVDSHQIEYK